MDPIANMITTIKNGYMAKKETVTVPYSKFRQEVAKALESGGYIGKVQKNELKLSISLIYRENKSRINEIKRVSKSGLRVYTKSKKIASLKGGRGTYIISTPYGVMTSENAKKKNLGGEVICLVW
ncbi:MAG: 30S ribosomal protein S8 [Patescibacteria group bacterium]